MQYKHVCGFLALGLTSLSAAANADDTGCYVGGKVGLVWGEAVADRVDIYRDDDTENLGVYGGYNFTPWFGVEGSWLITGNMNSSWDYYESARYSALSLTPKLSLRLAPVFSLYAKAGIAWLRYGEDFIDDDYRYDREDRSWSDSVATVGVGGQFDINQNIKFVVGYDYFDGTLDSDDDSRYWRRQEGSIDVELDNAYIGVHYKF